MAVFGAFLLGFDAAVLLFYGSLCAAAPELVCSTIFPAITADGLVVAAVLARVMGAFMIGLGALFAHGVWKSTTPSIFHATWHVALSGVLSYVLQFDLYRPLGMNPEHASIGALVHLVLAVAIAVLGPLGEPDIVQIVDAKKSK